MSSILRAVAALALVSALAGCGKGKGPATCEAAGARFLELAKQQLAGAEKGGDVDPETRGAVEGHLPAIRDALVRSCRENGWSEEVRACFANAAGDAAIRACYQAMPAEQRALLEKSSAGALPR